MDSRQLADKIRELREAAKLRQEDLFELDGLSKKVVQSLETGKGNPTLKSLNAIARALKVDISDLIGHGSARVDETHDKDALIGQLVALLPALNESQLGGLLETAKAAALKNPAAKRNAR